MNPNKFDAEARIDSLAEFQIIFTKILDDLHVTDFEINRLDISINTADDFDGLYKINSYLKDLYAVHIGSDNSYHATGDDFKKKSTKVAGKFYELEIYDKKLQSRGKDKDKTRIEFRFKKLNRSQSLDSIFKTLYKALSALPSHIEQLNQKKITQLYNQYLVEKSLDYEGRAVNLPAFVSKYADYIYNMDILSGLHGKVLKGKCKNWLSRYRASGKTLTLYSKSDLKSYIKQLKTAINSYQKGTTNPSPFEAKKQLGQVA
jgi:hypothetical protein